jgi:DNA-binding PadR family transcriptional regulator
MEIIMLDYITLGMLYNCRLTGYELKKRIENGVGAFYKASYGSIYPTLTRLLKEGKVTVTQESQGARIKKLYEITRDGKLAFLKWLEEPLRPDDGGNQNHLVKVYFFDVLPEEAVCQQLLEYEVNNKNYLRGLMSLAQTFEPEKYQEEHYYKLSTLYYGIGILRETLRWCRHVREKRSFKEYIKENVHE